MANDKNYISKLTLPTGSTYDIKDAEARELIEALQSYTDYLGVTTTELTDGATTNPITVNGKSVTAKVGNVANYGSKEFIFNGTAWQEFGDLSGLGALAYKSSASGTYTPTGSVGAPTFTGDAMTSTGSFTPAGSVSVAVSGTTTASGVVNVAASGDATYTPAGTNSAPAFTGDSMTSTGTYTPAGTISGTDVTLEKASIQTIDSVGTLPSATMPVMTTSVANENLTIGWTDGSFSAGTLPTKKAAMDVAVDVDSVTQGTFTGTSGSVSVTGTPTGSVAAPVFSGTGVRLETADVTVPDTFTASFTGTAGSVSVTGTPTGTNSAPTFTGTEETITVQ